MQAIGQMLRGIPSTSTDSGSTKMTPQEIEAFQASRYNEKVGALPHFDCQRCLNKGYTADVLEKSYPYMALFPCDCLAVRNMVEEAKIHSGFGELLYSRLEDFATDTTWRQDLKALAEDYIANFGSHWFTVLGQSGAGKTMLCASICNKLLKRYKKVRYLSWVDYVAKVKNHEDVNVEAEVLYIDDLLKGSTHSWDVQIAWNLINERYNAHLPTIISSELLIGDLIDVDESLAGRILERSGKYYFPIKKGKERNYRLKQHL